MLHWLNCAGNGDQANYVSDTELLQLFCERGDTLAFAQLVQRYSQLVWRVCYRVLRHHQDAEDAFQATFLVLATQARHIRKREHLADWLHGVALRVSWKAKAMALRRRKREVQAAQRREPDQASPGPDAETQAVVHRELAKLPSYYRTVVVLCDLQGLTRQEAARQLGISEGTVASRLARGRALLARRLRQSGLAVATGALAAPVQDALAACQPSLVSKTLEIVGAVLTGNINRCAGASAYLLAKSLIRSLTMVRVGMWTAMVAAVMSGAAVGVLGIAALYAKNSSGYAPPRLDAVASELAQPSSTGSQTPTKLDAEKHGSPAERPSSQQIPSELGTGQSEDAKANDRALAQAGPEKVRPPAADNEDARKDGHPADRWTHRRRWEGVESPMAVAVSPTGDGIAVADAFGYVKLYSLKGEKPLTIREPRNPPRDMLPQLPPGGVGGAFVGGAGGGFGGQLPGAGGFGGGFGGNVKIKLVAREERIWDLAFSPSGTLLAVALGARQQSPRIEIFAWQRVQDKEEWKLDRQIPLDANSEPRRVGFTPDGKTLLVGGMGRMLASYDVGSGKLVKDLTAALPYKGLCEVRDLHISSSGKYLALTLLWAPAAPKVGKPGGGLGNPPAGGAILGGPGGPDFQMPLHTTLLVMDLEKGERRWFKDTRAKYSPFQPTPSCVERVAVSHDEAWIAAMRMDAQVEVMELNSGKVIARFHAGEDQDAQGGGNPNPIGPKPKKPGKGGQIGGGGGLGGGGGIFGQGGPAPRSMGFAGTSEDWALLTSTPLVFFDPPTNRLVTWDYFLPGMPGSPRVWDVKTGKQLTRWDVSLTLRFAMGGAAGGKTIGTLGGPNGRYLVTVELGEAGGGFVGGVFRLGDPQGGQTREDMAYVVPAVVQLYSREDSLK